MGNPISEIAAHVLPGSGGLTVERTATGGSTPVYRIRRGRTTLYLRLAESSEASLAPEMVVHNVLRARGVRVPEVVSFDPFNQALQRSVMVTTEIPGAPLDRNHCDIDMGAV